MVYINYIDVLQGKNKKELSTFLFNKLCHQYLLKKKNHVKSSFCVFSDLSNDYLNKRVPNYNLIKTYNDTPNY